MLLSLGGGSTGTWAQAQTLPDNTLGNEASIVDSQGLQDLVTGGAARSNGLFHSFEALNVGEGRSLYFSPANDIDHIFGRVTGNSASHINGTLGVLGNADLFLLNPNGIVFGPNSQLDLAGSFVGSTASGLQFDGVEFSAVSPESVPLLTVTAPTGLNLTANGGSITNQSAVDGLGLMAQPLQTLALVGGDIRLVGSRMTNSSGRLELAAVQSGRVGLSPDSNGWRLDYGPVTLRGDIQLSDQSLVRTDDALDNPASSIRLFGNEILLRGSGVLTVARQGQGSSIEIKGDRVKLLEGASLRTSTEAANAIGGEIRVNTTQRLLLQGSGNNPLSGSNGNSGIVSTTAAEISGIGGAIVINTEQLRLEDGGGLFSSVGLFSTGAGGDIRIQATESLTAENSIQNEFRNSIGTETRGSGRGGSLIINTGQLQLDESYRLSSVSWVDGYGGDIEIEADSISLSGTNSFNPILPSGIATVNLGSSKAGGNIQIKTQDLTLADSANVTTTILSDRPTIAGIFSLFFGGDFRRIVELPDAGTGNAGDIRVIAETILVTGVNSAEDAQPSNIISGSTARGNAGNVEITTQSLEVTQGALVGSSSAPSFALFSSENSAPLPGSGSGQGGDLTINADRILVQGTDSRLRFPSSLATQALGSGDGGKTTINTRELTVRDGALVVAGTSNSGAGGGLKITASESIQVDGKSEALQIDEQEIPEQPSTIGTFAARLLNPLTQEAFRLTEARAEGDTGELLLKTPRLEITNEAEVSVKHGGSGNAGKLEVNANQLRLDQEGKILATSQSGQGGNVDLNIQGLLSLRRGSQITAKVSRGEGNGGNLDIKAGVILAIPDEKSDILASAVGGTGGNIDITAQGVFGIEARELPDKDISDITASSQLGLNGTVKIDLLTIDPSQGLTELPTSPLNPNQQISTACNSRARSRFVLTGRGGLPTDPRQKLSQSPRLEDWREEFTPRPYIGESLEYLTEQHFSSKPRPLPPSILEAQGWHIETNGTIRIERKGTGNSSVIPVAQNKCSPFQDG